MARAVYYSKKYTQQYQDKQETGAVAVPKVAVRHSVKMGPLVLIGCIALAVLAVLALPLMVGGAAPASSKAQAVAEVEEEQLNVAEYASAQEAMQVLGFVPAIPAELPEGYAISASRVVDGEVLELVFGQGKSSVVFRAAKGSDDLSGADHEAYAYTANETVDDVTRGYAGVSDKKLNLAVWTSGEYSYALVAEGGIAPEAMRAMAESIK